LQQIEQGGRDSQHDRASDPTKIGSVHGAPFLVVIFQYNIQR
jgi:hypothetical protein